MNSKKNAFEKLYTWDNVTLYRYAIIYLAIITIIIIALQVMFIFIERSIIKNMISNNEKRASINSLVIKKSEYEALKKETNDLLTKDNSFRIKDYVLSTLQKGGFVQKIVNGGDSVVEQPSKSGYIELSTAFELKMLGLEEVTEILRLCNSDPRVYFKEIEIKNDTEKKTLSLAFVIATTQILS